MPYSRLKTDEDLMRTLVRGILTEFDTPSTAGPLIVDQETNDGYLRVYVIWDEFQNVPGFQRGKAIEQPYFARFGDESAHKILNAVGLTTAEADRIGLRQELAARLN